MSSPRPLRNIVPAAVARLAQVAQTGVRPNAGVRTSDHPGLPAGVVPRPHAPTPTDSFDALFAPVHALVGPTAFAVHFLELVRPLLSADASANFSEYTRRYPNGLTFRVELHGNGKLGLPTVYDYDILFAIFHLAAERGVNANGTLVGVTFRDLARAIGWSDKAYGGAQHQILKTALNRWAALSIATNIDLISPRPAEAARDGRTRLQAVDALPKRVLPKLRWYDVLKFGIDTVGGLPTNDESAARTEQLGAIRLEPIWLDLVASGYTAWVDREFHASLDERYAKRLYEVLLVRALRVPSWSEHEPWSVGVHELLDEMGAPITSGQAGRVRRAVIDKLPMLADAGVLGSWREQPGRGDRHRLELAPGERLLAARSCAGLRMEERPESARLIWALQHGPWGFAPVEARHAVESKPAVVLRVLQYATYLAERGWEPRRSWGGWLKDAIREEYRFESDASFQAWFAMRVSGWRVPAWTDVRAARVDDLTTAVAGTDVGVVLPQGVDVAVRRASVTDPSARDDVSGEVGEADLFPRTRPVAEQDLPSATSVWGRTLRVLAERGLTVAEYRSWLAAAQVRESPAPGAARLVVEVPDAFAAEWVTRKWGEALAAIASADVGEPVRLEVIAPRGAGQPALDPGL